MKKIILGLGLIPLFGKLSMAAGTAYFTLPAGWEDNVTATIVAVAGSVLVVLALMFAYRKTVKSVNRS